jgi:phage-related protein (TIGR01555 family)
MPKKSTPKPKSSEESVIYNMLRNVGMRDAFSNQLARIGAGTASMIEATTYPLTRGVTRDYNLLNSLYRNNWIVRRIVETVPQDMMKNGWHYISDLPPEDLTKLERLERTTRFRQALLKGLYWGRLYGGGGALMLIDGQEDMLDQPLDFEAIMPGDFKGLLPLDRWAGIFPQMDLVKDISSPEYGLPEFYQFQDYADDQVGFTIHHSRIIRFIGGDLPQWEMWAEQLWGVSVVEPIFEELKKRDNTSLNLANLIFLANIRIHKTKLIGPLLAGANEQAQQAFYSAMQASNMMMNNFSTYVMGKDDDYEIHNANFSGLHEIYEAFMLDMSGATQIPVTKLFGRSPAGLSATGESDMMNYYQLLEHQQEAHLRPALEKLLPVLCMSVLGKIPDDIEIEFNPVETRSAEKQAELLKNRVESVLNVFDRGLISEQVALRELKQIGDSAGGSFSNITDEEINRASPDLEDPMEAIEEGFQSETGGFKELTGKLPKAQQVQGSAKMDE